MSYTCGYVCEQSLLPISALAWQLRLIASKSRFVSGAAVIRDRSSQLAFVGLLQERKLTHG